MEENYRFSPFQESNQGERDVVTTKTVRHRNYHAVCSAGKPHVVIFPKRRRVHLTLVNTASAMAVPCPGGNRIAVERIDILIPDNVTPEIKDVSYFALIHTTGRQEPYRIAVEREQVNELLALIGMDPLPESLLP